MADTAPLPARLAEIIDFFGILPPHEKRTNLIAYASQLANHAPPEGEALDLSDVRKDQECQDTVGIYLKFRQDGDTVDFYVTVGDKAQTLTKALASILCDGLSGTRTQQVLDLPPTVIPQIVGTQLFRQRSQTVYYVLTRMKGAVKAWLARQRREELGQEHKARGGRSSSSCRE